MGSETVKNNVNSEEEAERFSRGGRKFAEASVAEEALKSGAQVRKIVGIKEDGQPEYPDDENQELIKLFNQTPLVYRGPQGQKHRR